MLGSMPMVRCAGSAHEHEAARLAADHGRAYNLGAYRRNDMIRRLLVASLSILTSLGSISNSALAAERVRVTGEVVDSWCTISGIMYAFGTAHHQCATWCAVGSIPVSVRTSDGKFYMVLRIEGDTTSVANPRVLTLQSHEVTVDGDLYERDGVNYLLVDQVADDKGVINLTHAEHGIQPFGE